MDYREIEIRTVDGEYPREGKLSFFEGEKDVPFPIRRIYYIHGVKYGEIRGGHSHKALKQLLFCPYGKITILLDDGHEKAEILLDDACKGLVLLPGIWRDMRWEQDDSVLCVAASEDYDESDYIRNRAEFEAWVKERDAQKK